ncbi:MAG: hypothetical protein PHW74_02940 [Desulfobacca sp.]|nr:hypothetical protein [Desulfobacca sp.]
MQEAELRKWHRTMGIILALLIILQASSGLWLSFEGLLFHTGVEMHMLMAAIHRGGGDMAKWYRTLLGLGLLGMACSGTAIFFKIRTRARP